MTTNRTRRRLLQMGGASGGSGRCRGVRASAARGRRGSCGGAQGAADGGRKARRPVQPAHRRAARRGILPRRLRRGSLAAHTGAAARFSATTNSTRSTRGSWTTCTMWRGMPDVDPVFSVISGYRSPQTNEQLRERSSGVARHSLHLEGRAIDVRSPGCIARISPAAPWI